MTTRAAPGRTWRLRRPRTLRARVTIVASIAITTVVILGVMLLYVLQRQAIRKSIDAQLHTYTTQIAQSATTSGWPSPLPRSSVDPVAEAQVLAADGSVLAATSTLAGLPALYQLPAGSTVPVRQKAADGSIPADIRVVGVRTTVKGRPVTIVAGTANGTLDPVQAEFAARLLLGIPIALLLAAIAVWIIVGRALRPVERIRRAVTEITSADLTQRVPQPATDDEIGQLARTMNDMLMRLEDSASRQRRFVADASHELRSPLAAIRTTLEVGLAHPDEAPWPVIAERAAQQSTRLQDLIQQLLLLAKADERQLAARQEVELRALLAEIRSDLTAEHLTIQVDVTAGLTIAGHPGHLQRLFRNLIDNAVRYATSSVTVTGRQVGEAVQVQIDDDGPGIPAADRERVFDRFVRLDTSRERASGTTGLGLAIAREIALAHGGQIAISERPGGGTRAVVTLPHPPRGD
ncbi:ATP-binding protein [Kribbella sp.]|uniref:ATP-binding protein n=1 Tax=Kribbella sp. TaxID=1871183 RepID=UPI002D5E3A7C|nr:ATP-binding protein [Kribbella sp.]HZX04285.1 ATP-binding protein [Kribbella sp.]